jgi:CRP/FNR family transcriptional regulator, cyclic AMP receptor protein
VVIERFEGTDNRLRLQAITEQMIVGGDEELATEIDAVGRLIEIDAGSRFIEQDGEDNDIYLILAGHCDVEINGRVIARRGPGTHVGEMAALQPSQRRAATCVASDTLVALCISEDDFSKLGSRYPQIYRALARELARRLLDRNATIGAYRDKIRVFIISSAEALPIARIVQNAFEHDFLTAVWTDGVFKIASYTLEDLEDEVDQSDFAIAIAHADDLTESRGRDWPAPRDNVVFELGLFMGRLGKKRAILMEPRDEQVKLPSDLTGITTVPYRFEKGKDAAALMAPACNKLRDHILAFGPNNG